MLRRLERPYVASPSDHGDELWEVPEGGENPIGWNLWRVWPVTGRVVQGSTLGEPWPCWWKGIWTPFNNDDRHRERSRRWTPYTDD